MAAGPYGAGHAASGSIDPDVLAARRMLRRGLDALRSAVDDMRALDHGSERNRFILRRSTSPSVPTPAFPYGSRTRRPRGGEVPPRRPPTNAGPIANWAPGRQPTPEQSQDHLGAGLATAPATDAELERPAGGQPSGEPGDTSDGRAQPTDHAREVWKLVERAQSGDTEAFGLIYDKYVGTVFRFIYFRVGNRQLAEDLTSDTFLRALKRIGSVTWQGRDLGAWLVTIARNLVADHFKSGRYRLEVTSGDVLDADREDRGPEGSPESAVLDHITNVTLLTAVKQLNPEQQECIVLRFLQGFSVAETAEAMKKNEGAIKALQYRAVRALNRLLPEGFHQ
jgi:RNA polymerase sigma-70 factor (ECF subfamily)